jgi:PAS domain S-box-containing protein
MKSNTKDEPRSILRQKAEEMLGRHKPKKESHLSEIEAIKLVHELEVYQIELELQNEELVMSKAREAELATEKYAELFDFAPAGFFTLSHEGKITELNLSGAQMLSSERSRLKSSPFAYFVSIETRPAFHNFLGRVFNSNEKKTCELTLSVNGNLPVYVHLTGITIENKTKCLLTVVDISQVKELIELNQILLSSLPHPAMYIRRKDRVVLAANKIAADLGVEVGGHCWRGFMKTNFVSEKDRVILEKHPENVPAEFNIRCSFCLGDQCFTDGAEQNIPEVHAFGQIWNTYWVKVSEDVFLHYAVNITERKLAELALQESNERFQLLFNKIPLGYQSLDFGGNFIEVNQKWLDMIGYKREEVIGKWFGDFLSPAFQDGFRKRFPIFKAQGHIHSEFEMVHKNGNKLFIAFDGEIGYNLNGEFRQTHCILQDITESKRAEDALRESEEKLRITHLYERSLIEANLDPLVTINADGKITDVNSATEEVTGLSRDFLVKTDFSDYFTEPEKARIGYLKVFEHGYVIDYPLTIRHSSGKLIDVLYNASVYRDEQGKIIGVFAAARDITERKRAEEALSYEKYLLQTLMNNVPAHIYFKDDESRFVRINKAQAHFFGLNDPRQAMGKTDFDFFTKEHAQRAYDDEQEIIRTGQPINLEEKETWPDHPDTWVSTTKLPMRDKEEKIIGTFGISLDITERRKAEEELRNSEKKYSDLHTMFRLLSDNADDFMWAKDLDNKYIFANKTMCDRLLMAKDVDEPIGKTDDFFAQRQRDALPENPEWHTFGEICTDSDMLTLSEGKSMRFDEYGNVQGKFLFLDVHKAPIWDEHGNVIGVVGTARDVTHQRQLEEEKARAVEALKRSEENLRKINEEKDKFFSIIAHDLRAPFNGFLGLTEIMAEGMSRMRLDEIQKIANVMRSSATNLFRLLGNLLEWARMQMGSIPFIPVNSVLKPKILENLLIIQDMANKKEITIGFDIPEDLMVFTDVNMFGVIIRNLVTNAVKFTPKGGSVTISAKSLSDSFIEILVKDTGIGMNKSMIDNLFRLDTVTSRKGTDGESSSGLGLLICKDFIAKNGGILKIESEEGIGSTIRFTLPEKDQTISQETEA